MKIRFTEDALHDNYKFEVSLEIEDSWIDSETTKMAKHTQPMPDEDYTDCTIREHSVGNIIITVWKTNPGKYSDKDSWVGQHFIAPKIWKEEITARLMQTSIDLVKTIIAEIDIKLEKEIWKIVGEKENFGFEKEIHPQNEKVIGRCPTTKEALKEVCERIDAMDKKNEEIDLNTAFTSDEFTIEQNNDSGKIEIKMVFTGRSKKEFIRELTANEMHYVSEFAKFFIRDVVAQITWEGKYICGKEMFNSGNIEKTFLGDGKKDLIDEVFNYARTISGVEVYASDLNSSRELAKYETWLEEMRHIYVETFYKRPRTFEFDPTNDTNYCAFKIEKENSPGGMTIIMVEDKDAKIPQDKKGISFKDVLKEILREELEKSIEELKGYFEYYNHLSDERARLMQLLNSDKCLFKGLLEEEIKNNEKDLNRTKNI